MIRYHVCIQCKSSLSSQLNTNDYNRKVFYLLEVNHGKNQTSFSMVQFLFSTLLMPENIQIQNMCIRQVFFLQIRFPSLWKHYFLKYCFFSHETFYSVLSIRIQQTPRNSQTISATRNLIRSKYFN